MPLFDLKTDKKKEAEGVALNFGEYRPYIRRAGGSNSEFEIEFNRQTKKYKQVMKYQQLPDDVSERIIYSVYAKTVISRWETLLETLPAEEVTEERKKEAGKNDGFVRGIDWDGKLIPDSEENIVKLFEEIPDLFSQIYQASQDSALFREYQLEEASKN